MKGISAKISRPHLKSEGEARVSKGNCIGEARGELIYPSPPLRGGRDKNNGGIAEHPIHDEDMEDGGAEFCERLANRTTGGLEALEDETSPE